MVVVLLDVAEGGPVLCEVLETATVGGEMVVKVVWALLGVDEVVSATGVPVPVLDGLGVRVVCGAGVDGGCGVGEGCGTEELVVLGVLMVPWGGLLTLVVVLGGDVVGVGAVPVLRMIVVE